ncbi:MAG TPA: PAS domain S-box protein [Trichocoleus sp.]
MADQDLISQVPVALYQRRADTQWTALFFSDFIETLVGYPAAALTAGDHGWCGLIEPSDRSNAALMLADAIAQRQPFSLEYRVRHADGSWRWLCDRGQAVWEQGAVSYVSGVLFDITASKQTEEALHQSALTSQKLISAFPDLIIRMRRDSTAYEIITAGNVNVVHPADISYGCDLRDILPPEQVAQRLHYVRQALDAGTLQVYEQTFCRGGVAQWEEVRVAPWSDDEALVMVRDISERVRAEKERQRVEAERQQAEEQLRRSEEQFRSLVKNIPGAVYRQSCDQHWTALFFSDGIEAIYGYPASDFIGNQVRSVTSVIHPDDRDMVERQVHAAVACRQPYVLEYRTHHPDGSLRWIYEQGQGIFDSQGALLFLDGVVLDITERKQIEAELHRLNQTLESRIDERTRALRASERDLRTLFDHVYEGIVIFDTEGNILDVNRTLLELYGLTRQEMLQTSLWSDLSSPSRPHEKLAAHWQKALLGEAQIFDWQAYRPQDGSYFEVEVYLQRVMLRERQVILTSIRDISERKRVERERQQAEQAMRDSRQFLQMVMDNIPQAIFWKDQHLTYLGCNQVFAQAAGVPSPIDIIGKTDYDLPWTRQEAEEYRANDYRVMTQGQGDYHLLESQIRADGSHIWCDTNKVPLYSTDGQLIGILGTYEDITDRIRAEEALRESKQLLQLVMDNIPQYIFWKDRASVYLGCNQNFARAAGLRSPADIIGKTDYDLPWTASLVEEYRTSDRIVMENNVAMQGKLETQQAADGQQTWLETNKVPLHNAEGKVVGVLGTLEDITERKQAVDQLKEQVRLSSLQAEINSILTRGEPLQPTLQACTKALTATLEAALVGIWTLADGESELAIQASSGSCSPNGYSRVALGTPPIGRIADQRQPEVTQAVQSLPEIQNGDLGHPEWIRREGIEAFAGYPLIVEDQLLGVMGLFSRQAISSTVQDMLALLANEIALGIKRKQAELALAESESQLRQRTQTLEATLAELQRTQMQLIQSEKMSSLGQLVAGVAHEINNPVNFIYGNLNHARSYIEDLLRLMELYQSHYPEPADAIADQIEAIDLPFVLDDLPKLLNSMKVGADRIQKIVMSLRTFSRMDEAEQKAVDIHAGLDSTLMILQGRLKAKGGRPTIEVVQRYSPMPPIECYAGQLNQVFMNILSNAIDALEEAWEAQQQSTKAAASTPTITIETQLTDAEVIIAIADNGPGIPPAAQARLFDPFFTTKPIGKGTGMGLSISYQIITERHQGTLTCSSDPGEGTTFTITIPHNLGN